MMSAINERFKFLHRSAESCVTCFSHAQSFDEELREQEGSMLF